MVVVTTVPRRYAPAPCTIAGFVTSLPPQVLREDVAIRLSAQRFGPALAIIAKLPVPGACKTRLVPPLTHQQAAELSRSFLGDTADKVTAVAQTTGAERIVVFTGDRQGHDLDELFGRDCHYLEQRGETLGARLINAVDDLFAAGHDGVIVLDSDSPTLPKAYLEAAVLAIAQGEDCVTIGPAIDGGYYLLGMRRAHPELFEDIDWSTPRVCRQTLARARALRLRVTILPVWYDVDDPAALESLNHEFVAGTPRGGYPAPRSRAALGALLASP